MKNFILIISLLTCYSGIALADSVIVTETKTWQSVPITVDTTNNTYTVTGTVPTGVTTYYYAYPGYRCFAQKRDIAGITALNFNASVAGGSAIYCYPVQ